MTVAVCLSCGEFKHGAFNRCLKCGFVPADDESLTKHLLVTDHYQSPEALKAIADRVKSGQPIDFDPEALKQAWVNKEQMDAETRWMERGCLIFFAVVAAVSVVSAVLVAIYLFS